MKSRMEMSRRNVVFGMMSRAVGMITGLVGRGVFVRTLGSEYLGLGGFFGNIFSLIALCELGMGGAVCQSLYKPLAEENSDELSAIMTFFERVNGIVSALTLFLSLAFMPLLTYFSKGEISEWELYGAYMLFTLHTCISYMLSPKKCLVVCDQKMYVVSVLNTVVSIFALTAQSTVLIFTGSYIAYLAVRIFMLTLRDIFLNRYADRKYPFLHRKISPSVLYRREIKKKVGGILWHKIGGTLCQSTDSLLLSAYAGLSGMGKYSNYALVIGTVGAFFDSAIGSVSASVGNLGASDREKKSEEIMKKMYFLNFFLLTVGLGILVSCINPFISLWLGENMLFSQRKVWIIVSCFYFSCICDPVRIFIHAYGLFKETEFIPLARATVNFVLSVIFVRKMGIFGVFLGTLISTVTVPLFFEVKALYKHGFGNIDVKPFMEEMGGFIGVSGISSVLCHVLTRLMPVSPAGLLARGVSSGAISCFAVWCFYGRSEYWEFCKKRLFPFGKAKLGHKEKNIRIRS